MQIKYRKDGGVIILKIEALYVAFYLKHNDH